MDGQTKKQWDNRAKEIEATTGAEPERARFIAAIELGIIEGDVIDDENLVRFEPLPGERDPQEGA